MVAERFVYFKIYSYINQKNQKCTNAWYQAFEACKNNNLLIKQRV